MSFLTWQFFLGLALGFLVLPRVLGLVSGAFSTSE